ncbi:MAG: hypothetical protein ACODAQ_11565, partial [Phycisphaeraceae bacterium]
MKIDSFLQHYQLQSNPFQAEEARHDPVFDRLADASTNHPDFAKIVGRLDKPSTAVVFGEKGSGKTAMRLLIGKYIDRHNAEHPDERVLVVPYDDFNPVLDNLARSVRQDGHKVLQRFRLEDHQDAILARAVTELVDALLGEGSGSGRNGEPVRLPEEAERAIKAMPRQRRVDLAVLAALYDHPQAGSIEPRWRRLRARLGLHWRLPLSWAKYAAGVLTGLTAGFAIAVAAIGTEPRWVVTTLVVVAVAAAVLWGYWLWRQTKLWWLARRAAKDLRAVNRSVGELRSLLALLSPADLARQPLPTAHHDDDHSPSDARYQLTRRLVGVLNELGYVGLVVLVDRVDEPTLISGEADRMKALVWPMLDNKFLQQEGVGLKLLLPIELRHLLMRESSEFFQEARLDKQNMIDRLTWSGTTLYDLCTTRLNAVRPAGVETISLTDLFEDGVTRDGLIDALDQMHQPRDAFKFLYQVIQEHCRMVPEEEQNFSIPRLTLENVRKMQSQR